VIKPTTFKKHR